MKSILGTVAVVVSGLGLANAHAGFDWARAAEEAATSSGLAMDRAEQVKSITRLAVAPSSRRTPEISSGAPKPLDYRGASASMAAFVVLECFFPERRAGHEVGLAVDLADYPETDQKALALVEGRRRGEELIRSSGGPCRPATDGY